MARADWRDRFPEDITCVRCLQVKSTQDLDRLLWCEECQARARKRAAVRGWIGGGVLMLILAAYIWFVIQPDLSLIPALWVATLAFSFYLGARLAREVAYGWERITNHGAVEAVPPGTDAEADSGV